MGSFNRKKKSYGFEELVSTVGSLENVKKLKLERVPDKDPSVGYVHIKNGYQQVNLWIGLLDNPIIDDLILKHEVGHVYYNHLLAYPQLKEQVLSYRDDLSSKYVRYTLNVAMDMQINSTKLTLSEVEMIEAWLSELEGRSVQNIHPSRYGFPDGQSVEYYIDALMLKLEDDIKSGKIQMEQGEDGMEGDEMPDDFGDGDPSVISEEKYKELRDQQEKYGVKEKDPNSQRGHKGNTYGEIQLNPHLTAIQKLSRLIEPYMKRVRRSYRLDRIHSRNIYINTLKGRARQVYVPSLRYKVDQIWDRGSIDFLVDVSGSTNPDVNKKIVRDAFELISVPNKYMDIYMWNTDLVEKITAKDLAELDIQSFYTGGGTDLADGIRFIAEDLEGKERRPLVIISDLEDSLNEWKQAIDDCGYHYEDVLILSHGSAYYNGTMPKELKVYPLPDEYHM